MLLNHEKQTVMYNAYARLPLTARPLDLIYFTFFAVHLVATLVIDLQYLYPPQYVPTIFKNCLDFYIQLSRDPLIGGIFGAFGDSAHLGWFKTFIWLEGLFQVPVFVLGLRGLYRGSRTIYPLLVLYGASSATTTLACLVTVLQTPVISPHYVSSFPKGVAGITQEQRMLLLSSYIPFFLIPLLIATDMFVRVTRLVNKGAQAEDEQKLK